ncbi:hypothetical protein PFICI_12721 [Pestalotiopsis fici W106-1]|uniref:CRAL-TRIO domain-containing protein n=1 Tax=Pestalotiopsis fici (strain W106-1 / CGMCC3.15140) TaxID=1229662 RepID=W3WRM1_PESFW|nr:uncharacterized protein PFICI_12721 [Pestalotiopsis fici W106-1]ETS75777.1 hypothetical protein PFICI_12721 [Pestalotiopsis fici W106-1]
MTSTPNSFDSLSSLDKTEKQKLQETWAHLLRLCDVSDAASSAPSFRLSNAFAQDTKTIEPTAFRRSLWNFILSEDPDALVLRFLRARKWDVERALAMLLSAVAWRDERRLDETVILTGESAALRADPTPDEAGFVSQYRSGKSYVRGTDYEHRPVYVIRVRLHDPNAQSAQAMEDYVLHNIESIRLLIKPPYDKCCLLFDLTGFGLKNMDFHVVKFLLSVFEARYPETLGVVLVHNAPFVFWGLWNIIKGLLDPVVASKINFTRRTGDLLKFIPEENLQTDYGGGDAWDYEYVEPEASEDERLKDIEKRDEIQKERDELIQAFEKETAQWASISTDDPSMSEKQSNRKDVADQIRQNYWKLDPYIRARTYHQRVGIVDKEGNVDFMAAKYTK